MERSRIAAWPGLELVGPLSGGARGSVVLARRGSAEYVVRNSTRTSGAIDWELDYSSTLPKMASACRGCCQLTTGGGTSMASWCTGDYLADRRGMSRTGLP